MKNIYLFDEYVSSQKNGIGTYLRELLYCLESPEYNINLVIFNADTQEFNVIEERSRRKFLFPVLKGHFLRHVQVIEIFLRLYIKDESGNVFFVNHSPCKNLLASLKMNFPYSKVVFTIHDFGWTSPLMGNLKKFKHLLENRSIYTDEIKKREEGWIVDYFEEEKEMYQLADKVVCLSKDSCTTLRSVYKLDEDKISFIPNGLRKTTLVLKQKNVAEIRKSLHIRDEEKIIVAIGRPTRQKGIFALMEAMKLVLKINKNVRLVIVGDANEQSFRELMQAGSSCTMSISFTGLQDRSGIYKWLSIADIGVIPSYYEQCSFVGIEMMMFGLPIVSSNGIGIRNMFQENENGLVVKIGNRNQPREYVRNLAKAITKLLESPDLCDRLGVGARKTYQDKYLIGYMSIGYKRLIESLVKL